LRNDGASEGFTGVPVPLSPKLFPAPGPPGPG
jgi:hypothetical protein